MATFIRNVVGTSLEDFKASHTSNVESVEIDGITASSTRDVMSSSTRDAALSNILMTSSTRDAPGATMLTSTLVTSSTRDATLSSTRDVVETSVQDFEVSHTVVNVLDDSVQSTIDNSDD